MRDDDNARPLPGFLSQSLPPTVTRQPDPMLEEGPAGSLRVAITALGAAVVVVLVLYGLTRPPEQQQVAASSEQAQTAPAAGGPANSAGQAQPANATAQNPQTNAKPPTTTGQGAGERTGQPDAATPSPPKGQAGQSKNPPAAGGSATSDTGPGAKPAPAAK